MNAAVSDVSRSLSTEVQAVLNYTRDNGLRPVNYSFDPPPGVSRYGGELDPRTVTIHDARPVRGLSLDVSGFELVTHQSSLRTLKEFQDPQAIRSIDYLEVEAALRFITGAEKVILFDHTLRDSTLEIGGPALREPVR